MRRLCARFLWSPPFPPPFWLRRDVRPPPRRARRHPIQFPVAPHAARPTRPRSREVVKIGNCYGGGRSPSLRSGGFRANRKQAERREIHPDLHSTSPRTTALDAARANRLFYRDWADRYDTFEDCVANPRERARLRGALRGALELVGPNARVLDACGGTGYASAMLVELGARPVTVDISPDMLAVWTEKAHALGYEPEIVEAEILDFLTSSSEIWDLIVFSSALHHLDDYLSVVRSAATRLQPGGVLLTIFDPTRLGTVGKALRRIDYIAYVCLRYPADAWRKVSAKVRRARIAARSTEINVGSIAELHAQDGVDDEAIRGALEEEGMEVLKHERVYGARLAVVRSLFRILRLPSSFSFLARRPLPVRYP